MTDHRSDERPFEDIPFRIRGDPSHIYRRSPESGLWIGHDLNSPPSRRQSSILKSTRTFLSYSDVTGTTPDRDGVIERLCRYDLGTILNGIGQISSAIHGTHGEEVFDVQIGLIQSIFDDRFQPVARAFLRHVREALEADVETPSAPVVVFHELQLVNLARLAILNVPQGHSQHADDVQDLAVTFLMANDLLAVEGTVNHPPLNPQTAEEIRDWERFLLVNGVFHHDAQSIFDLTRTWDLYLTDRPNLQDSPVYHDFPTLIEELTGLEPLQLWARLFAVYGHWGTGPDPSSGQAPNPLTQSTYFTDNYRFNPEEEAAFWSLVSASVEDLRQQFTRQDPDRPYNPYDIVPLEKKPLVRIDDQLFCPSALLMKRRMTKGLHHLLLNRVADPDGYLTYMGDVFEDYLLGILRGTYGEVVGRLIREEELEVAAPSGTSVCDAVVDYGDGLLLVEAKAKRLSLDVRVRGDLEKMNNEVFRDVFIDPARQIDSVIKHVRVGSLTGVGLDPGRFTRYVPISVTLDSIPMNPYTYSRLRDCLEEEGLLQGISTLPLQLLAAEDVEMFEAATESGHSVLDLLVERVRENNHQWAGFQTHLAHHRPSLMDEHHPRLHEQFRELAEQAQGLFSARAN